MAEVGEDRVDGVEEPAEHRADDQRPLPRGRPAGHEARAGRLGATTSAGRAREAGARKARATPNASTSPKMGSTDVGPVAA